MLEYDRIDISEVNYINKTSALKNMNYTIIGIF